jgi:hypothetical protein
MRGAVGLSELVSRYAGSGLPVREVCRREGINVSLFRRWSSRLGRAECDGKGAAAVAVPVFDLGDLWTSGRWLEVCLGPWQWYGLEYCARLADSGGFIRTAG